MDFKDLTLSKDESDALTLLKSNKLFDKYIDDSVISQIGAAKEALEAESTLQIKEYRDNNVTLLKDLKTAKTELDTLKVIGGDANKQAQIIKEMQATFDTTTDTLNGKYKDLEGLYTESEKGRADDKFTFGMMGAIAEHNKNNPTMKVVAGANAQKQLLNDARSNYKVINDKYVMLASDGKEFTNDNGFGSMSEWIGGSYLKDNAHMVQHEAGSNPSGNNGSGSGSPTTTQDKISSGLVSAGYS